MDEKRHIKLDGPYNFRDLGGYPAARGRTVKWGRLFRSDDLIDITPEDLAVVDKLGLRTVIDFRDKHESIASPDILPESVGSRYLISIEAGRLMTGFSEGRLTREKAVGIMLSVYRTLVLDFQPSFREFFAIVSEPEAAPLLFHCTAGKDRTGVAAALLLSALGVGRQNVIEDYLLSKECLCEKYRCDYENEPELEPLYSVRPEFLAAALDAIDREYGGMETYLRRRLEVDLELLRDMYTVRGVNS